MKLSTGIQTLRVIIALALLAGVNNTVAAQNNAGVQSGVQTTLPATPPLVPESPTVATPSVIAPPQVAPPEIIPPELTPPVTEPAPAPAPKPARKKGPVDALKPGDFVWVAQDSYEGPMKIVVVLDIQRVYVFQNDKLIGFSTISSGKKGKETPTGIFNILQKNVDHKSNLYSNAPMPYMQRLTWDGIALHGGHLPGYPASHGCIRLPHPFAKSLFGVTQMNQEVVVLKDTATPAKRPPPVPDPIQEPAPLPVPSDPLGDPTVTPPASPPKPEVRT